MKNITIKTTATIKEAMETLAKTAEKVLLVVGDDQILVGTLTDGDIRKHILKGAKLTESIQKVYNQKPIFVFEDVFSNEEVKKILISNKIDLVPIVDKNCKLIDFVTWERAFGNSRKVEKQKLDAPVVIMAGGRGSRLEPFTKVLPKPLIPVGEKPVIDHIIDRFQDYGIEEFYLTINHLSKIIRAYFEEKTKNYTIKFIEETEPRGTAGSINLIKEKIGKPFFVSNCDIIVEANYSDIYDFHIKNKYDITLVASAKQFNIPYGICELNDIGCLERIREKPEYNFLVNTGLYVLNPGTIELIPDNGVFHITDLIEKVKENMGSIGVYPVSEESWIDVGQWAEYRKALKLIEGI